MIRSLKPKPVAYKVADAKGLFLLVTPVGDKLWRLKFRNSIGVEKKLALGAYPEIKLRDAREARDQARSAQCLIAGIQPFALCKSMGPRLWPAAAHFAIGGAGHDQFGAAPAVPVINPVAPHGNRP
jgi:hypothetical protein